MRLRRKAKQQSSDAPVCKPDDGLDCTYFSLDSGVWKLSVEIAGEGFTKSFQFAVLLEKGKEPVLLAGRLRRYLGKRIKARISAYFYRRN